MVADIGQSLREILVAVRARMRVLEEEVYGRGGSGEHSG